MQRKMMKRQRPSSPDIPHIEDEEPLDTNMNRTSSPLRTSKRQRVLPPSLDGPSRGWANPCLDSPHLQSNSTYEDDDDYYDDDLSEDEPRGDAAGGGDDDAEMQGVTMQKYRNVNSLLHDLHAEQQYRRVLSSSPGPSAPPPPPSLPIGTTNGYGQAYTHRLHPHSYHHYQDRQEQQQQHLYHTHPHPHHVAPQLAHYAQTSRLNSIQPGRSSANGDNEGYGYGSHLDESVIPVMRPIAGKQSFPSPPILPPHAHVPSHLHNPASYHHPAQSPLHQQRHAGNKGFHLAEGLVEQEDEEMGEEDRVRERYEDTNKSVLFHTFPSTRCLTAFAGLRIGCFVSYS